MKMTIKLIYTYVYVYLCTRVGKNVKVHPLKQGIKNRMRKNTQYAYSIRRVKVTDKTSHARKVDAYIL